MLRYATLILFFGIGACFAGVLPTSINDELATSANIAPKNALPVQDTDDLEPAATLNFGHGYYPDDYHDHHHHHHHDDYDPHHHHHHGHHGHHGYHHHHHDDDYYDHHHHHHDDYHDHHHHHHDHGYPDFFGLFGR